MRAAVTTDERRLLKYIGHGVLDAEECAKKPNIVTKEGLWERAIQAEKSYYLTGTIRL